jgi:hypothetical protein
VKEQEEALLQEKAKAEQDRNEEHKLRIKAE